MEQGNYETKTFLLCPRTRDASRLFQEERAAADGVWHPGCPAIP